MIINKNNLTIPDYLDEKFIRNVLLNRTKCKNIQIQEIDFSMGSSGGENYLSSIYRVQVIFTENNSSPKTDYLIVKSVPFDGPREKFAQLNIFDKEKEMYLDIIPRIEDCLEGIKMAPECYFVTHQPIATIVFEDMNHWEYSVADRVEGLNEDHCKVVLSKLAEFHAGSMLLLEKEPSIKESELLRSGIFSSLGFTPPILQKPFNEHLIRIIDFAKNQVGYEKIGEKLEKLFGEKLINRIVQSIRISPGDIVTICHGDMWVNNFLFKYGRNNESPTDMVLIDFQASVLASIGLDINYFLVSSLRTDVLFNKRDELIENAYYATFKRTLETGGYKDIPTLRDVQAQIRKKAYYGFMTTTLVLPLISMRKEDSGNNSIENLLDEEEAGHLADAACSSERFLECIRYLLKEYDSFGLFD